MISPKRVIATLLKTNMTKKNKKPGRLAKALLETAGDMRKAGLLDRATYEKITMRQK